MEHPNQLGSTGAYAPCPCGSGKKVKFCCGVAKKDEPERPASDSGKDESGRPQTFSKPERLGPSDAFVGYRHGRRKV